MKFTLVLLLLIALFFGAQAHRRYQDFRAIYWSKSVHHKKLAIHYFQQARKFFALARQYHTQARVYLQISKKHIYSARSYTRSAKRHHKAARKLRLSMGIASKRSKHHYSRSIRYRNTAIRYEGLARQARSKAAHHMARHRYYASLYRSYKLKYQSEIRSRDSARKSYLYQKGLERSYLFKARASSRIARDFSIRASRARAGKRSEKRLYKKYTRLYRRSLILHELRIHKRSYRKYRKQARLYKLKKNHHLIKFRKYQDIEEHEIKYRKETIRVIEELERQLIKLNSVGEKDEGYGYARKRAYELKELISKNRHRAEKCLEDAERAKAKAKKHYSLARSFESLQVKEESRAKSEKRSCDKYRSLYKATFVRRRRVVVRR